METIHVRLDDALEDLIQFAFANWVTENYEIQVKTNDKGWLGVEERGGGGTGLPGSEADPISRKKARAEAASNPRRL